MTRRFWIVAAGFLAAAGLWAACNESRDLGVATTPEAAESALTSETTGVLGNPGIGAEGLASMPAVDVMGLLGEEMGRALSSHVLADDFEALIPKLLAEADADESVSDDERLMLVHHFDSVVKGMTGQFNAKYSQKVRQEVRENLAKIDIEKGARELLEEAQEAQRQALEKRIGIPIASDPPAAPPSLYGMVDPGPGMRSTEQVGDECGGLSAGFVSVQHDDCDLYGRCISRNYHNCTGYADAMSYVARAYATVVCDSYFAICDLTYDIPRACPFLRRACNYARGSARREYDHALMDCIYRECGYRSDCI